MYRRRKFGITSVVRKVKVMIESSGSLLTELCVLASFPKRHSAFCFPFFKSAKRKRPECASDISSQRRRICYDERTPLSRTCVGDQTSLLLYPGLRLLPRVFRLFMLVAKVRVTDPSFCCYQP